MRALALILLGTAACGAGTIQLPARPRQAPSRPIVVDMRGATQASPNMPAGVSEGVERHLVALLYDYGFQVVEQSDADTTVVHVLNYDRNKITADLFVGWGEQPEHVVADAGSCTSVGWGVYADQNEECLARALLVKMFATQTIAQSYGPAPLHVGGAPGSFTRPGDDAGGCHQRDAVARGDCEERLGHLATAWTLFRRAGVEAPSDILSARIAAIEPRLARMRIVAPSPVPPGLVVTRDGTDVTSLLDLDIPVDPGDHLVEATAPGYPAFQTRSTVRGEGTSTTVTISLSSR